MTGIPQRHHAANGEGERYLLQLLRTGGADRESGVVVTQRTLALMCRVSVRQLQRRIRRLREAGLLLVDGRRGYKRPNRYRTREEASS